MFWKNTIILISGSAIEKDTNAVQKLVSEKEAFFKDHISLSLLLFAFFTVGHFDLFNHSDYRCESRHSGVYEYKSRRKYEEECEDIT